MNKVTIKNCTLYHGDCFEIMQDISEANCMITDPPYNCTQNDWDHEIDLDKFWSLSKSACKKNAAFVIFCQMPFAARLYMSNPKMFRYEWIYKKPVATGFLDVRKKPLKAHELVYVFCERLPEYAPQMKKGEPYTKKCKVGSVNYGRFYSQKTINSNGDRFPTTILDIKHENTFYTVNPLYTRHPTQKSVAALSYLVKTYTDVGDTVLDPFMGSGTTGVAAIKHGRKFIGIEQDQKWFDVACKRIEAEYQKRGLLDLCENENASI